MGAVVEGVPAARRGASAGQQADVQGPDVRERRSTAWAGAPRAGGSRAPHAQVVVELDGALGAHVVPCVRAPRSSRSPPHAEPRGPPARCGSQAPAASHSVQRRRPRAWSSRERPKAAPASAREARSWVEEPHPAGTRWRQRPRPCWRCPCRRSPVQRLTQRQSRSRPERGRCLRPAPRRARQSAVGTRRPGPAALACRRGRPSARQAALSRSAPGGTRGRTGDPLLRGQQQVARPGRRVDGLQRLVCDAGHEGDVLYLLEEVRAPADLTPTRRFI